MSTCPTCGAKLARFTEFMFGACNTCLMANPSNYSTTIPKKAGK
ncbi:hypothetical protein [Timonella senegalensis]|nr:hypothetical protein [Timonella senegalensis]